MTMTFDVVQKSGSTIRSHQGSRPKLTNGWNGSDNLSKLQFVQNRRFSSGVKTHWKKEKKSSNLRQNSQWNLELTHQNPHLFLAKKPTKQTRNGQPHNLCAKFSQKLQKFVSKIDKREISKYETDWEIPDLWSREIYRFSVKMPIWRVFQGDKKPKNNEFLSMCRCSQSTPLPTQL